MVWVTTIFSNGAIGLRRITTMWTFSRTSQECKLVKGMTTTLLEFGHVVADRETINQGQHLQTE